MKIDDQVKDPTYKGVFNFMDGANEEIEYEYDKNGNLVKDLNKNISKIEYNLLNLPSKITFGDGKTITYVYDASGVKLLASYKTALPASSHSIAYCGNMIYKDDAFRQILLDGGYITFTDNRAMYYDAAIGRWFNSDPLAEKIPSISLYAYCMDNPIIAYDPNGMETHVISNSNGTYTVIGGVLNKDRNIYVYTKDKNGKYIKGKSIGITTSTTSFYNSDEGKWERVTIDPSDTSGRDFLNKMVSTNITLDDYMDKARNNHPYDFKITNGGNKKIDGIPIYRGMIIGGKAIPLYTSARDIGNIAAGIVAAKNGISWSAARIAFDAYQSRNGLKVEGISTRNAEYYGWSQMYSHSNGRYEAANMGASIKSFFSKMFYSILNIF